MLVRLPRFPLYRLLCLTTAMLDDTRVFYFCYDAAHEYYDVLAKLFSPAPLPCCDARYVMRCAIFRHFHADVSSAHSRRYAACYRATPARSFAKSIPDFMPQRIDDVVLTPEPLRARC